MKIVRETETTVTLAVTAEDIALLAREELDRGVDDPEERDALRCLGYPPPRLVRPGEAPPVSAWTLDERQPCESGHADSVDCELCRGVCLGGPGAA